MIVPVSRQFEQSLRDSGLELHRVTGGVRYVKLVCEDMHLVVARNNAKRRHECEYKVGLHVPSLEEVIARYTVDAAKKLGIDLKHEPLLAITFFCDLIQCAAEPASETDLRQCFRNFLTLLGNDYSALRTRYLDGLSSMQLPPWVAPEARGGHHYCDRSFVRQVQLGEALSTEFRQKCNDESDFSTWYHNDAATRIQH